MPSDASKKAHDEHLLAHYGVSHDPHARALVEVHGMDPHHVGAMHGNIGGTNNDPTGGNGTGGIGGI